MFIAVFHVTFRYHIPGGNRKGIFFLELGEVNHIPVLKVSSDRGEDLCFLTGRVRSNFNFETC